jgi:hypothetical protein
MAQILSHRRRYLFVVIAIRQEALSNERNDLLRYAHHPFCMVRLSFDGDEAGTFHTHLDPDHESKGDN